MEVQIKQCKCEYEFQDQKYGKNMRVFNPCGKDGTKLRCTVCGSENSTNTKK